MKTRIYFPRSLLRHDSHSPNEHLPIKSGDSREAIQECSVEKGLGVFRHSRSTLAHRGLDLHRGSGEAEPAGLPGAGFPEDFTSSVTPAWR